MKPEQLLFSLRHEQVVFVPNPGNAGDGLIAAAEYFLFRDLGLSFRVADANAPADVLEGETVIYGGGGNLVGLYGNARRYLESCHRRVKRVVILPRTIRENEDLLAAFGKNVTIFCRDYESFDHVRRVNSVLNCYLSDDMALILPIAEVLGRSKKLGYRWLDLLTLRFLKRVIRFLQHVFRSKGGFKVLNAFRGDIEGCGRDKEVFNVDVSQVLSGDNMSESVCRETAYFVLKFINCFDKIRTDRLHVCISAALLGKQVEFYDNSYGKNSSVYFHSLHARFPNVKLMMDS